MSKYVFNGTNKAALKNTVQPVFENISKLKTVNLSVPMVLSGVGMAAALFSGSKQLHIITGLAYMGLSAAHGIQHRKKVGKDFERGLGKMSLLNINIPTNKMDLFIRSVEISSYIPGRARLYSKKLINNQPNCQQVLDYLHGFKEIADVTVNPTTGSILIKYEPEVLRQNKELAKVEYYIRTHARR